MRTRRRCGGRLTCTPCGVRCIGRCTGALRSRRSWRWSEGGQAGARERGSAGARSATVAEGFGGGSRRWLGGRMCFATGGVGRDAAPAETATAGSGVARPGHSGGGGVEAVPGRGVRGAGRASGGEAAGPQLRTRWRRRDPLLGYCRDGGGFGYLRWAEGDVAVVGAGAVGLATARLLQRRGRRVTIYDNYFPRERPSGSGGYILGPGDPG